MNNYIRFFKTKIKDGSDPLHVVIACVLLAIENKLSDEEVSNVLFEVFDGDIKVINRLLLIVPLVVSDEKAKHIIKMTKQQLGGGGND